jgi:hypothetical protein
MKVGNNPTARERRRWGKSAFIPTKISKPRLRRPPGPSGGPAAGTIASSLFPRIPRSRHQYHPHDRRPEPSPGRVYHAPRATGLATTDAWRNAASAEVLPLLGADQALWMIPDPTHDSALMYGVGGALDRACEEYLAYFGQFDVGTASTRRELGLAVYHRDDLYHLPTLRHTELYNDWCVPHRLMDIPGMAFDPVPGVVPARIKQDRNCGETTAGRAQYERPNTTDVVLGLSSCASWARARTLLIQRGQHNQPNSSNLQPSREFVSPDAGVAGLHARLCRTLLTQSLEFAAYRDLCCPRDDPGVGNGSNSAGLMGSTGARVSGYRGLRASNPIQSPSTN